MNVQRAKSRTKSNGMYTVEFAIVGSLFFLLFFAAIEVSRLLFTWNVLTEVSRRGARLATVCNILTAPQSDSQTIGQPSGVATLATFGDVNMLPNLSAANVTIQYLAFDGSTATSFGQVRLVRFEISNYQHELYIPGLFMTLNSPTFSTTLPRESLGVSPYAHTSC